MLSVPQVRARLPAAPEGTTDRLVSIAPPLGEPEQNENDHKETQTVRHVGAQPPMVHASENFRDPAERGAHRMKNKRSTRCVSSLRRNMAVRKWTATVSRVSSTMLGRKIAWKTTRTGLENPVAV